GPERLPLRDAARRDRRGAAARHREQDRGTLLPGHRHRVAHADLPADRPAREDQSHRAAVSRRRRDPGAVPRRRVRRLRPGAAARRHDRGAGPVSFDSFPLLVLAPVVAALLTLLAVLVRRARLRATARWTPSLLALSPRGRLAPWLVGAAALLAGVGAAGPPCGPTHTAIPRPPPNPPAPLHTSP